MKVKKQELLDALAFAKLFTDSAKDRPRVMGLVLVDGPGKKVMASDGETFCSVNVPSMTDSVQVIEAEKEVVFPDAAFRDDLTSLKIEQLRSLAEYAGLDCAADKKATIVKKIYDASEKSAEDEKADSKKEVGEKFCVQADDFIRIIKSLSANADDMIDLFVDEFTYQDGLFRDSLVAWTVTVGEHFQKLSVDPPDDFPLSPDIENPELYLTMSAQALEGVSHILSSGYEEKIDNVLLLDGENKNVVGCDIKRLYLIENPGFVKTEKIVMRARVAKKISQATKTETISIFTAGEKLLIKFGNVAIVTYALTDFDYPAYAYLLERATDSRVVIGREILLNAIRQASLLVENEFGIRLSFNGGLDVGVRGLRGLYSHENVPFVSGSVSPPVKIWLKARFMEDILSSHGVKQNEKVELSVINENEPLLVFGKTMKAIIMPMKAPTDPLYALEEESPDETEPEPEMEPDAEEDMEEDAEEIPNVEIVPDEAVPEMVAA